MRSIIAFMIYTVVCYKMHGQQLVLRGDYPDPSVTRIGDTYWASATTSNWFPAFPLMQSRDLINWKTSGYVFNKMPGWADYYFWAPEISYENGKIYVYYAAHKKNGNLCVGVASADKPEGPYKDHGPLMCQEDGSIDAFPVRDENGKLFLVWKEDGNSVQKPTPIWIMEMNEDRTALVGEKTELFRNSEPWEGNLVEGVSIIRHGGYFYAFYAAAGCCGAGCTYKTGIARAKTLLGKWEKYNKNPVITNTENWVCPGHGTPIEKDNKFYFLYHAYDKSSNVYTGRQGLLVEFRFTKDDWIEFVKPFKEKKASVTSMTEDFKGDVLSDKWQWSVSQQVNYKVAGGQLQLQGLPTASGAFLGQKTESGSYNATTLIVLKNNSAAAGIAAIGNESNLISVAFKDGKIKISTLKEGQQTDVLEKPVTAKNRIYLRMQVRNGKEISFLYSTDGSNFILLNQRPCDGSSLPPWDRAVRVGLVSKGDAGQAAYFESFNITGM